MEAKIISKFKIKIIFCLTFISILSTLLIQFTSVNGYAQDQPTQQNNIQEPTPDQQISPQPNLPQSTSNNQGLIANETLRDDDPNSKPTPEEIAAGQSSCTILSQAPVKNRRLGICNDGIYTLQTRETDSAGNKGQWITKEIERDTVRPDKPGLEVGKSGDIIQEYLSLSIAGEAITKAEIQITSTYSYNQTFTVNLNNEGNYSNN